MKWRGKEVTQRIRQAAAEGISDAAAHLLEHANRTVPHDEGTLERSGSYHPDTPDGVIEENLTSAVYYDTVYAARLHESEPGEMQFRGKGQRKWLERAGQERQRAIRDYIADKIRAETRRS